MTLACAGHQSLPEDKVAAVVQAAEGLPLLVEDLLATGDLGGIPPRFADTVRARLARLDTGQRRVLDAAALLGRRFDWRLLERAAAVPNQVVGAALDHAAALQLVVSDDQGLAFRHALTRDVVLADLAGRDRQRLSLSAAEALAAAPRSGTGTEDGTKALLVGRLLVDGGQPARAAEELLAVAAQAVAAGEFAGAELFLREADQISANVPETVRIMVAARLAEVMLQAGRPARPAASPSGPSRWPTAVTQPQPPPCAWCWPGPRP